MDFIGLQKRKHHTNDCIKQVTLIPCPCPRDPVMDSLPQPAHVFAHNNAVTAVKNDTNGNLPLATTVLYSNNPANTDK